MMKWSTLKTVLNKQLIWKLNFLSKEVRKFSNFLFGNKVFIASRVTTIYLYLYTYRSISTRIYEVALLIHFILFDCLGFHLFREISNFDISEATATSKHVWWTPLPHYTTIRLLGYKRQKREVKNTRHNYCTKKQRVTHGGCHNKYVSAGWSEADRRDIQRSCNVISVRLQISCPNGGGDSKSHLLSASASSFLSPAIWERSNSIPDMVHKIVTFSKNRFIGNVVVNNLLPSDSVPLLSVSEGIRNGNRKPGLLYDWKSEV